MLLNENNHLILNFGETHILNDNEFVPHNAKVGLNVVQLSIPYEEGYIHYVENIDNSAQYLYDWSIYSTRIDGEYLNDLNQAGTSELGFPNIPIEWYSNNTNQWYQEQPATLKDATIGYVNEEEVLIELYAGGSTGRSVGSVDILFRDPQSLQKIKQFEISDDIVNDLAFVNYLNGNAYIAYTPLMTEEDNNLYHDKSNKIKVIKFDIENETILDEQIVFEKDWETNWIILKNFEVTNEKLLMSFYEASTGGQLYGNSFIIFDDDFENVSSPYTTNDYTAFRNIPTFEDKFALFQDDTIYLFSEDQALINSFHLPTLLGMPPIHEYYLDFEMLNDNDFILLTAQNHDEGTNNQDSSNLKLNILSHRFDSSGTLTENPKLITENGYVLEQWHNGSSKFVEGHITTQSNSSYIIDYTSSEVFRDTINGGYTSAETARVIAYSSDFLPKGEILLLGTFEEDQTISIQSTIEDLDGLGEFSYNWYIIDNNNWYYNEQLLPDQNNDFITLTQNEVGKSILGEIQYTDLSGFSNIIRSQYSDIINNVNDVVSGQITINNSVPSDIAETKFLLQILRISMIMMVLMKIQLISNG